MNIGGILGGAIAAVIGAVVWAAVAYYANVEIGYLAWGIGLLVGLGVSAGSRTGGVGAALIAVVLTLASLLGGKYAAVHLAVSELDSQFSEIVVTDDDVKFRLADGQTVAAIDAGQDVKFQNGKNYETAEVIEDYPAEFVTAANEQFDAMSEEEVVAIKEKAQQDYEEAIAIFKGSATQAGFWDSFGPIDIVFFLLGVVTAAKIAYSDLISEIG